ncbi:AAA family ATPase [Phenylobacterium sp.]|uniref:AAA family ATPase n=1 Tax=Phenylobacterium sp. TaxID=1871053 RepID=UPI00374D8DFD
MDRFVVITGCSGGGKSTLLEELARRGYATVEEPGRRIVREELARGGQALPWIDGGVAFLRRAIEMALADRAAAQSLQGWVFFDRGLIDAASGVTLLTGEPALTTLGHAHRYNRRVFMTPPWPEIYVTDPERRHGLSDAEPEYHRLLAEYPTLGYAPVVLPKVSVADRADLILRRLGACA